MSLDHHIEKSRELAYSGKDYPEIKKEMSKKIYSQEDLNTVMLKADDFIVEYQLAQQEKGKVLNYLILGVVLFLVGMGITIGTFLMGADSYIIAYGAILAGGWLAVKNYMVYQSPMEDFIPRSRKFRSRRDDYL